MQFKKLAAIAGSAIMAGMTLAGPALASTITGVGNASNLVSVTDSTVSFPMFVIGSNAATADVAGAVDIAVNFAANAKVTSSVTSTIPGESVTGGVKLATGGVPLTPYTNPQAVKGIITASDIPSLLNGGSYSTASGGAYQYKQYLYMLGESTNTNPAEVIYARPTTENSPRLAFKTPGSSILYTYKLTFSSPVSLAGVASTTDLQAVIQGTTLNFLGKDFVISDCAYTSAADTISSLTLLGGKNIVTAETGTPQTVAIDSKDYTVTLTGVAAQSVGTSTYYSAIGDVNGESFTLKAGETKTLSDGTLIAAIKVFQGKTGAPDYATIAIGADKVTLTSAGTVTKGTNVESKLASAITATTAAGWSVMRITYTPDQDAWLAPGASMADAFASTFNIKFNSIVPDASDTVNRQTISFNPSGYNMLLTYKNADDAEKQMYSIYQTNSTTSQFAAAPTGTLTNGDNGMRDVVFDEGSTISAVDQDYFVIQKGGFSHTMQLTSYTNSTKQYTFTDESGNSITATGSTGVAGDTADLIVDGNTFKVTLINDTAKTVNIDLNGNAVTAAAGREYSFLMPKLITTGQGGLYFYKGVSSTFSNASATPTYPGIGLVGFNQSITGTTGTLKVGTTTIGTFNMNSINNITGTSDTGFMDVVVTCTAGAIANCTMGLGTSATGMLTSPGFVLAEEAQAGGTVHNWVYVPVSYDSTNSRVFVNNTASDDTNYANLPVLGTSTENKGMTTYGTFVDSLSSNLGGSATLNYPDVFTYANVYVLSPTGTVVSGGTGGAVTTDRILPITADVVKLDSEVTNSDEQNNDLVVVGGPCINTVAAAAMGLTYPACGAASGIPTNAALIKVIADKFATGKTVLLVAGWEAADTDLAARIVQNGFPSATAAQKAASELTVTGTVASPSYS
jgi:hypothetical protein